jgi:hypothetical protein
VVSVATADGRGAGRAAGEMLLGESDGRRGAGRAVGEMLLGESDIRRRGRRGAFLSLIMGIMILKSLTRIGNACLIHA